MERALHYHNGDCRTPNIVMGYSSHYVMGFANWMYNNFRYGVCRTFRPNYKDKILADSETNAKKTFSLIFTELKVCYLSI